MKPRYFIVCHILDLPKMLRSVDPLKYASYNDIAIIDGLNEKHERSWHKLRKLRERFKRGDFVE